MTKIKVIMSTVLTIPEGMDPEELAQDFATEHNLTLEDTEDV